MVTIPVSATARGRAAAVHLQHRRPVGPGRRVRGLRHPGTQPGPGRSARPTLDPGRAERGHRDHAVGHGQNVGTAAAGATTVNFTLGGVLVGTAAESARCAAGAPPGHPATPAPAADGTKRAALVGGRPGQHGRRAERHQQQHAPRRRSWSSRRRPAPDLQVPASRSNPPNPGGRRGGHVHRGGQQPRHHHGGGRTVTRVTVGGTTLNTSATGHRRRRHGHRGHQRQLDRDQRWRHHHRRPPTRPTWSPRPTRATTRCSQSIVVGRGAAVPYTEYEAESRDLPGTLLTADPLRTFGHTNFAHRVLGPRSRCG